MSKKRIIVDGALILALILIAVFCYNMGKSYKVLFENLPFVFQGNNYPAIEAMQVTIDSQAKPIYLLDGDRMIGTAVGRSHTLTMEFLDINDEVTESRTIDFNINDLGDNLAINVARAFQFGSLSEDGQARYEPVEDAAPAPSVETSPGGGGFTFGRPAAPAAESAPEPAAEPAGEAEPYVEEEDPAFATQDAM